MELFKKLRKLKRRVELRIFMWKIVSETFADARELAKKRFHCQSLSERRRRIEMVEELFVRLREAKEDDNFATAYAEDAVVAIFDGNHKEARKLHSMIDTRSAREIGVFSASSVEHLEFFAESLDEILKEYGA